MIEYEWIRIWSHIYNSLSKHVPLNSHVPLSKYIPLSKHIFLSKYIHLRKCIYLKYIYWGRFSIGLLLGYVIKRLIKKLIIYLLNILKRVYLALAISGGIAAYLNNFISRSKVKYIYIIKPLRSLPSRFRF